MSPQHSEAATEPHDHSSGDPNLTEFFTVMFFAFVGAAIIIVIIINFLPLPTSGSSRDSISAQELLSRLNRVEERMQQIVELPRSAGDGTGPQIIESILRRVRVIEDSLITDPKAAMSLALLNKDLELLKELQDVRLEPISERLSRHENELRWNLGIIFTIILALFAAVTLLFSLRRGN